MVYQLTEQFSAFGGVLLGFLMNSDCNNCTNEDQSLIYGIPLGVNIRVSENVSFDLFYQSGFSAIYKSPDIDWDSTMGISYVYTY